MRQHLFLGLTALSLVASGCARKDKAVVETPPPATGPAAPMTNPDDVDLVELPAMQADLRAKAGSDTVYFATDEYGLDAASRTVLTAQARWMLSNTNVRASIEGHADERGTREYNLALGERRANSARDFLIAQGVPMSRLLVVSWGKERPAATGSNEAAWAQNRRAVTVVVK